MQCLLHASFTLTNSLFRWCFMYLQKCIPFIEVPFKLVAMFVLPIMICFGDWFSNVSLFPLLYWSHLIKNLHLSLLYIIMAPTCNFCYRRIYLPLNVHLQTCTANSSKREGSSTSPAEEVSKRSRNTKSNNLQRVKVSPIRAIWYARCYYD